MPCLKCIIQNANKDDLKLLRGKTIECVSMIGVAVGPEKFMHDASEIMDLLLKTHNEVQLPDDDPQTSYLISAWTRICKILGKFLKNNFFKGSKNNENTKIYILTRRKRFSKIFTTGYGTNHENRINKAGNCLIR